MWSKDHSSCVECDGTDRPHFGKGLCRKCYLSDYNKRNADKVKALRRTWYEDNMQGTERQRLAREQRHFSGNRQAVLKRDDYKCRQCSATEKLVVHHEDKNGRGRPDPNNEMDNLITLCRSCHIQVHRSDLYNARRNKKSTRYSPNLQATARVQQK